MISLLSSVSMALSRLSTVPRSHAPVGLPWVLHNSWEQSSTQVPTVSVGASGAESVPRSHKKESAGKRQCTLQGYLHQRIWVAKGPQRMEGTCLLLYVTVVQIHSLHNLINLNCNTRILCCAPTNSNKNNGKTWPKHLFSWLLDVTWCSKEV